MLKWIFQTPAKTSLQRFKNWRKPKIKENQLSEYNWIVRGVKGLQMGTRVDIGAFTYINATYGVVLGDDVQIGGGCKIYSVSTIDNKHGKVVLENNAKIGANSVVMPGVTIGANSVVGALSFINKDVPPNQVWVGCPAKRIK